VGVVRNVFFAAYECAYGRPSISQALAVMLSGLNGQVMRPGQIHVAEVLALRGYEVLLHRRLHEIRRQQALAQNEIVKLFRIEFAAQRGLGFFAQR
jgi:hypothetical protein